MFLLQDPSLSCSQAIIWSCSLCRLHWGWGIHFQVHFPSCYTEASVPSFVGHIMGSPERIIDMKKKTSKTKAKVLCNLILEVIFHHFSVFCWSHTAALVQCGSSSSCTEERAPGGGDHWGPFWRLATTENKLNR